MRELLVYLRESLLSRINSMTETVASSFVCTSPLVVKTVVGFLEAFTVSNAAELRSFLLNMGMDAPESTTNSLFSGFITDGAGRHQASAGEKKKLALSFSFSFIAFSSLPQICPRFSEHKNSTQEDRLNKSYQVAETATFSLRTLAFFFPLETDTFPSFNANWSLSTLYHCSRFNFPMPDVKVS